MTTPENVYIVTRGEYSDYRIRAVFLDRAEAEACYEAEPGKGSWGGPRIEVWGIGENPPTEGTWIVRTHLGMDGTVLGDSGPPRQGDLTDPVGAKVEHRLPNTAVGWVVIEVTETSPERALKVLSEVKARTIDALRQGLPPSAYCTGG